MARRISNKITDRLPFSKREEILARRKKNKGKATRLSDFEGAE